MSKTTTMMAGGERMGQRNDAIMRARRPGTKAPQPRGAAALPSSLYSWSLSSVGWYLRREQLRRDSLAEDEDNKDDG